MQLNAPISNELFKVFPNPSNLNGIYLNIAKIDQSAIQVNLLDLTGHLVLSKQYNTINENQPLFIQTETVESGIYMLEVTIGDQKKNIKIVLNNNL